MKAFLAKLQFLKPGHGKGTSYSAARSTSVAASEPVAANPGPNVSGISPFSSSPAVFLVPYS